MAVSSTSDYSTQGSDEIQEMYCEHCHKHDNQFVPAEGFCVDCVEYLCDMCFKYHKRYNPSHTPKDKDNMPQDFCFEKCSSHKDEIIKFYCQICEKLVCSVCKITDHQDCQTVSHFPTYVEDLEKSKDFKDLMVSIDELLDQVEQTEEQVGTNIERVTSQEIKVLTIMKKKKEEILSAYKIHQKEIIDQFEKKMEATIARLRREMEETTARLGEERKNLIENSQEKQRRLQNSLTDEEIEIQKKAMNTSDDDQKVLQSIKAKTSTMKTDLKSISSDLEQYQKTGQRCKLFIAMKTANENTEKLKHNLTELKDNNDIHYYIADSKVQSVLDLEHYYIADSKKQSVSDMEQSKSFFSLKKIQYSELKRKALFHSCIQVKLKGYTNLCLFSEDTLLMIYSNLLTIIEHIRESSPCCKVQEMDSQMGSAVKIDEKQVAVTFPKISTIRVLTFQKEIKVADSRDIKAPAECKGIAYSNDTLIVSTKSADIHVIDMSGKRLKTFTNYRFSYRMFSHPVSLAFNPANTILYTANREKDAIISLTLEGETIATHRSQRFSNPTQMAVDKSGAVFVCWSGSGIVQQLSSDLTDVKILLDKKEIQRPCSVAICNKTNRLYVGTVMGQINVYQLSIEKD